MLANHHIIGIGSFCIPWMGDRTNIFFFINIYITFAVFPVSSTLFRASIIITLRKPARVILCTISDRFRMRPRTSSLILPGSVDCGCPPSSCWLVCVFCLNQPFSSSRRRFNIFLGTKKRSIVDQFSIRWLNRHQKIMT